MMTSNDARRPAGELAELAREIAKQTAWDMALSEQPISEETVREIEHETLRHLREHV